MYITYITVQYITLTVMEAQFMTYILYSFY